MKIFDRPRRPAAHSLRVPALAFPFITLLIIISAACLSQAQTFTVLHNFTTFDGEPWSGLTQDGAGNVFGVGCCIGINPGFIYEYNIISGRERILHRFSGTEGNFPTSVIRDSDGNLYGTNLFGGDLTCSIDLQGCGTIFMLDTSRNLTILHSFIFPEGGEPYAGLIRDSVGELFGVTGAGGISTCAYFPGYGCGTIFKLYPNGVLAVLHAFDGNDGASPQGALIRDKPGNYYGTTANGGINDPSCYDGCGSIFKLDAAGNFSVLHQFAGGAEGGVPRAGLIRDTAGNLYGTTTGGAAGGGTVFKLDTYNNLTVLHSFSRYDGFIPTAALVRDAAGNLYGTTYYGGQFSCGSDGCGTIFKIDANGAFTTLYNFDGATGQYPNAALIRDAAGTLYGTAAQGRSLRSRSPL